MQQPPTRYKENLNIGILILFAVLFKLIPPLPNFSPQLVFSLYFASHLSKNRALLMSLGMWLFCDMAYAFTHTTALMGSWTWFTYSGFIFCIGCFPSSPTTSPKRRFILCSVSAAFFFWCWTNMDSWLFSGMYSLSFSGFLLCYNLALPFLIDALLSSLFWSIIVSSLPSLLNTRYIQWKDYSITADFKK